MKISCPQCGSENLKRLPGAAVNGWNFIKAGFFIVLLAIILPISTGPMTAMGIVGLLFGAIGCLTWILGIGRSMVSSRRADWSWECQACKKEFCTNPLDE